MADIIEGTPEMQRGFEAKTSERQECVHVHESRVVPDVAGRDPYVTEPPVQRMTRHIMQQIVAETPYKPDTQWDLWHQAQELEEHNHLPDGVTAHDVYMCYLQVFHHE